jgi:hypothetical protein
MTVDLRDFENGLRELVEKAMPPEISKGMFRAGNELLRDSIYKIPKAPFDEGHLRGSAKTQAANGQQNYFKGGGLPANADASWPGGGFGILAGFNIVYAARWHELTPEEDARINWTLPGSGRKYLETKLVQYKEKYRDIVGLYLKNLLAKRGKK